MFDHKAKCVLVEPTPSMQQCMDDYGIEGEGEWVNNTISQEAKFWSCGMVARESSPLKHDHDPMELARCHSLANEAAALMGEVWQMLRSGSDPDTQPFFITAQRGAAIPSSVSESLILEALGGTLNPEASVVIEPFTEGSTWWKEVEEDAKDMAVEYPQTDWNDYVNRWRALMVWFSDNKLSKPSFVRTTDPGKSIQTLGCVFPCFVVGISDKGSLVGIATHVVE